MFYVIYVIAIIVAYSIGSISPSLILYKKKTGKDIRSIGSNSAGTTNIARGLGKKYAILVFICDFIKGILGVFIAVAIAAIIAIISYKTMKNVPREMMYVFIASAFAVVLGHIFPVYYGFKGGKGVATSMGAFLWVSPFVGGYIILVIAILALIIKTISIASLISFGTAPIFALFGPTISPYVGWGIKKQGIYIDMLSFVIFLSLAIIIFWTHRGNIKRIIAGTESSVAKK